MFPLRSVFTFVFCLASYVLVAQAGMRLPSSTHSSDWYLGVSDVQTTTLIFPHDVVSVDRGTEDVLTQTLDEVTNIVKVKTAGEYTEPSSLTVITSGGMVYTFRVCYERSPAVLTYRLEPLRAADLRVPPPFRPNQSPVAPTNYVAPSRSTGGSVSNAYYTDWSAGSAAPVAAIYYPLPSITADAVIEEYHKGSELLTDPVMIDLGTPLLSPTDSPARDTTVNPMGISYGRAVVNTNSIFYVSQQIHNARLGSSVTSDRTSGSELELNDIWIVDDKMYYRFTLVCKSNISYDIDFWRFYVIDAKQRKRTAVQEREVDLVDVYSASDNPSHVGGYDEQTFVVAVDKFTIPDKKRLVLELFEQNGGRHHSLKIKNKDIVKARLVAVNHPVQVAR